MDELLNAALDYAAAHPASLQGFLHWLRRSGAEVKREAAGGSAVVRVMTVHGAKGLQAPLVILPDTTALPDANDTVLWAEDAQTGTPVPLFAPFKGLRCGAADRLVATATERRTQEHNRLLYVALTRAEDRLVVCGWQPGRAINEGCWYAMVQRAFAALVPQAEPFDAWEGSRLRHARAQSAAPASPPPMIDATPAVGLPAWAGTAPDWRASPPPPEPTLPSPLAPSRPEGAGLGTVPQAASPLADRDTAGRRFRRGVLIHALLQHLPALPAARHEAAVRGFLARPGHDLPPAAQSAIAAETLAILRHPDLAALFGVDSRAEVPLTGVVAGAVVGGLVDRLAVLADRVLVADFKTNRDPPARAEDTPVLYLRQMAAYRAVLRAIFPGKTVQCVLVWTQAARMAALPEKLLDDHAPGPPNTGIDPIYGVAVS